MDLSGKVKLYFNPNQSLAGMIKMGKELKIDIYSDLFMPYFFYKCSCSKMGECSLQEYANGLTILKKKSFSFVIIQLTYCTCIVCSVLDASSSRIYYYLYLLFS